MNLTDDIAVDPAIEAAYRRGYYQGAEAYMASQADGVSDAQVIYWLYTRLKRWAHDQSTMSRRVLPPRPGGAP